MNKPLNIIAAFLLILPMNIFAQDIEGIEYKDKTYKDNIKTVQLHVENEPLSYPIIKLNSGQKLHLSFDELGNNNSNFIYTIIHCTTDWNKSDLYKTDYVSGFEEYEIENHQLSFNTNIEYANYNLIFPNNNMQPIISGNYILVVIEEYSRQPVLTMRFYVTEQNAGIKANIHRAVNPNVAQQKQEVDFEAIINNIYIANPYTEIKAVVMQNKRFDNKKILTPKNVNGSIYNFNYETENLFNGCNEFKHIDTKNIRFAGVRTLDIYYRTPYYHFRLIPEINRRSKPYQYEEDINGNFFIHTEQHGESNINADYIVVDFELPYSEPLSGDIFVFGGLSMWQKLNDFKMKYNFDDKKYRVSVVLKQGYYNYLLVYDDKLNQNRTDVTYFEGNFSETENNYLIFIYYSEQSERYDRLISYGLFNSVKRI